jgi:DNA-binding SARP family transcriptional activator
MLAPGAHGELTTALLPCRPGGKRRRTLRLVQCRVEFKILGDIEVHVDGQPIAVGGPRTRAVLAMLVVNAGGIVAADVLQDELGPDQPAGRAAANLQVRMSELRGALRACGQDQRLVTRPPGYLLRAERVEVDASRFEALLARGRDALTAGDAPSAANHLREALALWRGPALAGLTDVPLARSEAARLEEVRLPGTARGGGAGRRRRWRAGGRAGDAHHPVPAA